jgi:hypothetical protein
MENFGARNLRADDFCREEVSKCDLFVGIVGHLYGSCPEGCDQSYTEREYEAAIAAKIPRLMFVAPESFPVPADLIRVDVKWQKQKAFRDRVKKERITGNFMSPERLALGITQAIRNEEHSDTNIKKRAPFMAPSLPEHFVPRPEKSEEIKRRLLTCNSDNPGVLVISALHGLGGIGKTVLASVLAYDKDIQRRYSDGILWVTLGQKPDVLSQLSNWIKALGDDEFHPTNLEAASMHLRTILHDKYALLVIDDAWDPAFAKPFLVGGSHCQVLITTRDSLIARAVGAFLYDLDVMTQGQSLSLLSKCLGCKIGYSEQQEALDLVHEVGHLPLALELAASQVKDGVSWSELLSDLKAEVARLESLDMPGSRDVPDEATRKNLSLKASFQLSLQRLPEEKQIAFIWLGVLPEDVVLTPKMAVTLWKNDLRTAQETLRYLRSKALLLSGEKLDGNHQTYRLHDLIHDLCRNLIIAPVEPSNKRDIPGLGLSLKDAHSYLLERYLEIAEGGLWHTLTDDGYIHENLVWHMERADRLEDIHCLLREETADGKNAWYQTRERLGQTGGYIENIACCWLLTEKRSLYDIKKANVAPSIGLETRYAMIISSVNNLFSNIPSDLLCELVKNKLWTPQKGMIYARKIENDYLKVKVLSEIMPFLSDHEKNDVLYECMAIVDKIRDEKTRTDALMEVVLRHPEPDKVYDLVNRIKDRNLRDRALADIIPKLSDSRLAINLIRQIDDGSIKGRTIVEILPGLSEPQSVFPIVDLIKEDRVRSRVLIAIAPYFPHLDELLASAYKIKNVSLRRSTSKAIKDTHSKPRRKNICDLIFTENLFKKSVPEATVIVCDESQKMESVEKALAEIWQIKDESSKDNALAKIALKLHQSQDVIDVIKQIRDTALRVKILTIMAPNFQEPQKTDALNEAFDLAKKIDDAGEQTKVLKDLACVLSQIRKITLLKNLLEYIKEMNDRLTTAFFLVELIPSFYEPLKAEALREALSIFKQIKELDLRAKALIEALPNLPEPLKTDTMKELFEIIKSIRDERLAARLLVDIASHPNNDAKNVLDMIERIKDNDLKDWTLAETASRLEPWNALIISRQIKKGYLRSRILAEISSKLPENKMSDALKEALSAARDIDDHYLKARSLAIVAIEIPKVEDALNVSKEIKDDYMREKALSEILSRLSDPQRALLLAGQIKDRESRDRALAGISHNISQHMVALEVCGQIEDEYTRGINFAKIASRLSEQKKSGVLKKAINTISEIEDEDLREQGLVEIVPYLLELKPSNLHSMWSEMLHTSSQKTRSGLLSDIGALVPIILALGGEEALLETARAIEDVGRWWP